MGESYSNADEYFEDQEFSSEEESEGFSDDDDDEWRKTPLVKRILQERKSMGVKLESKRKRDSLDSEDEDQDDSITKKRTSKLQGCTCKKGCKTKACSCKKAGSWCVAICKCDRHACANREVPGTDVSSSVETDKENEDLDDTDQLLDSTYDVNKIPKLDARSPMKSIFNTPTNGRSSGADLFAADSDIDATPKQRPILKSESIFSHPQID